MEKPGSSPGSRDWNGCKSVLVTVASSCPGVIDELKIFGACLPAFSYSSLVVSVFCECLNGTLLCSEPCGCSASALHLL
jgi:hypothetical protein